LNKKGKPKQTDTNKSERTTATDDEVVGKKKIARVD
jgi:hypothetical protein